MQIITKADVDKFLKLVKAGLKDSTNKELNIYDSAIVFDGTEVTKEHYVSLEFRFKVSREVIDRLFVEDSFDVSNEIDNLLK